MNEQDTKELKKVWREYMSDKKTHLANTNFKKWLQERNI
jgi:hypothetical protein